MRETVHTYCQICEQACGLKVTREHNRIIDIAPDTNNRNSWRDFCVKGASAGAVVEHPQRILTPMQRVGGRYVARSYRDAVRAIGGKLNAIIATHGAAAVGSYAGNPNGMNFGGSLFLSLFMDAIGSHNRYWVGSLDQNALHYVAEKMYGHPFVTLQLDLDACASVLLIGANPAVSGMCWIGYNADGWKRLLARQAAGLTRVVIADPRRTESARKAAVHLQTRPDSDWALCLALIKIIFDAGWEHRDDCALAEGINTLRALAAAAKLTELAACCDIPVDTLYQVAEHFAHAAGAAAIARTGSAIGRNGSLTEWLSHALNFITGNTDSAGGRFYNAGLVDPLLAGDEIFPPNKVPSRVRGLPTVAGFHATAELADEIVTPGAGQIRALFIVGGNPVVSGPDGAALDHALSGLELLVAVDLVQRESHRHAEWLIPAAHWLEREEFHPLLAGLGERAFAQFGREVVKKPTTVMHEWEFLRPRHRDGRTAARQARRQHACTRESYHRETHWQPLSRLRANVVGPPADAAQSRRTLAGSQTGATRCVLRRRERRCAAPWSARSRPRYRCRAPGSGGAAVAASGRTTRRADTGVSAAIAVSSTSTNHELMVE
jgi:formate dehydrogenase